MLGGRSARLWPKVPVRGDPARPVYQGTFTIDPTRRPKAIDFTQATEGPTRGRTVPGIYEVAGDRLRVCRTTGGPVRSTAFPSRAGRGQVLLVLERVRE